MPICSSHVTPREPAKLQAMRDEVESRGAMWAACEILALRAQVKASGADPERTTRFAASVRFASEFLEANGDMLAGMDHQERVDLIEELMDKADRRYGQDPRPPHPAV